MSDWACLDDENGIVLGEGRFGSESWNLVFLSDAPKHPDDRSGPGLVVLRAPGRACGRGPEVELAGPFGPVSGMYDEGSPVTWVYGEVASEVDAVRVACAYGEGVDAVIVECGDRFPFNFFVALLPSRPSKATAIDADGERFTQLVGWGRSK